MQMNRRSLLVGATAVVGVAALAGCATADDSPSKLRADPFTLGVASGDPTPDGAVLWTRLAVEPLAPDGRGGMPASAIDVLWEVSTDDGFATAERSGTSKAVPELGHSVHVEVEGLQPGTPYFYRFRTLSVPSHTSSTGRFVTAPTPDAAAVLDFAVASCAHYQHGYFHAYQSIADDWPDLVFFLGDYIYENVNPPRELEAVRRYQPSGARAEDLKGYRLHYSSHHLDPQLRAAHEAAAWVTVFDDHEVQDNFNGSMLPSDRAAAGFQAWYENLPVRIGQKPNGSSIQLFRRLQWGSLATFHMLDTRQYRDAETPFADGMDDPGRTITGEGQMDWLQRGFVESQTQWDVLAQQVFFAQRMRSAENSEDLNGDKWDGYQSDRERVIEGWRGAQIRNPVVLTGDHHAHIAGNVSSDFGIDDPIAAEILCSSVTSKGVNSDNTPEGVNVNPNLKYGADKRGYVRCHLDSEALTAEFMVVSDVSNPKYEEQQITVDQTVIVEDRVPGVQLA